MNYLAGEDHKIFKMGGEGCLGADDLFASHGLSVSWSKKEQPNVALPMQKLNTS